MTSEHAGSSRIAAQPGSHASEDAGERWYQLIQEDSDLIVIARSLRHRADRLRLDSKSRGLSGQRWTKARQMLREEADLCILIARRAESLAS